MSARCGRCKTMAPKTNEFQTRKGRTVVQWHCTPCNLTFWNYKPVVLA